jgi:hypothetical protein
VVLVNWRWVRAHVHHLPRSSFTFRSPYFPLQTRPHACRSFAPTNLLPQNTAYKNPRHHLPSATIYPAIARRHLRLAAPLPSLHTLTHDDILRLEAPLQRIPRPLLRPARRPHRGPHNRRRPLPVGSADPRARGHALRRRRVPRRAQVSQGLSACAAEDDVFGGCVASERYVDQAASELRRGRPGSVHCGGG